jgi:hypothetical protein
MPVLNCRAMPLVSGAIERHGIRGALMLTNLLLQAKGAIDKELANELKVFIELLEPLFSVNVDSPVDYFFMLLILPEILRKEIMRQRVSKRVYPLNVVAHVRW